MAITKLELLKFYKSKTVLIIDDYPDMRGSIRRMIENFGVRKVNTASDGVEAITMCEELAYDIILADYNLGDSKNGQQILEELRYKNLLKNTSVYMMITAETSKDMVFGALEYQPDDYLTKPFTQAVLERRLDRLIVEKEALYEINNAIDAGKLDKAVALCQQRINIHDKYEHRCYRIMGSCLYKKQNYDKAKQVYQHILEQRDIEWANIGLGKSMVALGELVEAKSLFSKLIERGSLCLEFYDCMADITNRMGDPEAAQKLLEQAIKLSPNAILRQQALANISEDNHNWEQAEKSRRKIIKLSNNSVYESPEHHFSLARTITAEMDHNDAPQDRIKDVNEVFRKLKRKYTDDNTALQADIIGANALAKAGDSERLKAVVGDLQQRMETAVSPPAQLMLDMVATYNSMDDRDKAKDLLKKLARTYEDNDEVSDAIDRLSDEPLSAKGKQKAVDLNNAGKKLFTDKEYGKAIALFSQALLHYPNNMGLNLNLMLALVREMTRTEANSAMLDRCSVARDKLSHLSEGNPLFDRYKVLGDHYNKLHASFWSTC